MYNVLSKSKSTGLDDLSTEIRIQIATRLDDVSAICLGLTSKANYEVLHTLRRKPLKRIRKPRTITCADTVCGRDKMGRQERLIGGLWDWMGGRCVWCGCSDNYYEHHCSLIYRYCIRTRSDCSRCLTGDNQAVLLKVERRIAELEAHCAETQNIGTVWESAMATYLRQELERRRSERKRLEALDVQNSDIRSIIDRSTSVGLTPSHYLLYTHIIFLREQNLWAYPRTQRPRPLLCRTKSAR